jgi:hypothetical protein
LKWGVNPGFRDSGSPPEGRTPSGHNEWEDLYEYLAGKTPLAPASAFPDRIDIMFKQAKKCWRPLTGSKPFATGSKAWGMRTAKKLESPLTTDGGWGTLENFSDGTAMATAATRLRQLECGNGALRAWRIGMDDNIVPSATRMGGLHRHVISCQQTG